MKTKLTKQQRKDIALKEYEKIQETAWEEYWKKCEEIDEEEVEKCSKCGQVLK